MGKCTKYLCNTACCESAYLYIYDTGRARIAEPIRNMRKILWQRIRAVARAKESLLYTVDTG